MPEKKMKSRKLEEILGEYDKFSIDELVAKLTGMKKTYAEYSNLFIELIDTSSGYSDDPSFTLTLFGDLLESDKEFEDRVRQEKNREKARIDYDLKQLEALKKKYEGK
jgi:hypothetical protein